MLTVVLLPGMDGTGSLFEPFVTALGSEFGIEIVRYPTTGALGYAELEAHARRSLPSEGRFVILGESFSGPIAVSIAASRPARLVGLILCSSFIRNPLPIFGLLRHFAKVLPVKLAPFAALNAALLGRFSTSQLRSMLAAAMSEVSAEALRARLRAVLSVEVSAKLKAVNVPLLYLLAKHDQLVPISALKQIQRAFPDTQVVSVEAPHFLLQAAPTEAADSVRNFIGTLQDQY